MSIWSPRATPVELAEERNLREIMRNDSYVGSPIRRNHAGRLSSRSDTTSTATHTAWKHKTNVYATVSTENWTFSSCSSEDIRQLAFRDDQGPGLDLTQHWTTFDLKRNGDLVTWNPDLGGCQWWRPKCALSHQIAVKFQRQGGKENQRGVIWMM